jgi:hypothetical protein
MKRNVGISIFVLLGVLTITNFVSAQSPDPGDATIQMATVVAGFSGGRSTPSGPIVGPDGGRITSPSGRLSLDVPPGALSSEIAITIGERAPDAGPFVGPVYDLGPSRLQFQVPVTLTIHFSSDQVPPGYDMQDVAIIEVPPEGQEASTFTDQVVEEEPDAVALINLHYMDTKVDVQAGTAAVQIKHFSSYAARAYSTYTLGDLEHRNLGGVFDVGNAADTSLGTGASYAAYGLDGFLEVQAAVPVGSEGMANGTAVINKWFRIKASDSGESSVGDGTIGVLVHHNGRIDDGSNNYHVVMTVQCLDAYGHFIGAPQLLSSGPTGGQFTETGQFIQAYHLDPYGSNNTDYPLGPPYALGKLDVIFRDCQLVAGEWYIVAVNLVGAVWGFPPAERLPPSGGWVEWTGISPSEFLVTAVTVEG